MNSSVWIAEASAPGACKNSELVVGSASITTSHLRLDSACCTWLESGPMLEAVMPDRIRPCILPLSAWSWIVIHEAFEAGVGAEGKTNTLFFGGFFPYPRFGRARGEFFLFGGAKGPQ